jgi:hypothetical protein
LTSCLGGRKGGWNEWEETDKKQRKEKQNRERKKKGKKREKEGGEILPNCPDLLRVERYGSCSLLLPPCSSNPELKMMKDS